MMLKTEQINPMLMSDEQIVDGALDWVNIMRAEHDLPALEQLPKGRRADPADCALARALAPASDGSCKVPATRRYSATGPATWNYSMNGEVVRVEAPPVIAEFIVRFDLGRLDHLLA